MNAAVSDAGAVADFVHHEAGLLDGRLLEQWLELFAEDGRLWVPGRHGDIDPARHVSIIYDDVRRLRARVTRLLSGKESAQDPPSRTLRAVTNLRVCVEEPGEAGGAGLLRADTVQVIHETRGLRQALLILPCRVKYRLRRTEGSAGFEMVEKRIELLEVERHYESLSFLL